MKALIIDDEEKARSLLSTLLEEYCPEVTDIETAGDLLEGIEKIDSYKPNIIFLDIEMPTHLGTEIFDLYKGEIFFDIVFTTAYSEYAIKAFEMNAMDYLLKPLRPSTLKATLLKVKEKQDKEDVHEQISLLRSSMANNKFSKIGLPVQNGILFVQIEDIIFLEADGMYTNIYISDGSKQLICKPLRHYEALFKDIFFMYRPHRSFIINLNHIKQYVKEDGAYILMDNNQSISISKDKKDEFFNIISNI